MGERLCNTGGPESQARWDLKSELSWSPPRGPVNRPPQLSAGWVPLSSSGFRVTLAKSPLLLFCFSFMRPYMPSWEAASSADW